MRDIYYKPDGTWHPTREEVEWINGAAARETALRAQVEELTREVEMGRKDLIDKNALTIRLASMEQHAEQAEAERDEENIKRIGVQGLLDEANAEMAALGGEKEDAEAKLARVVEALERCLVNGLGVTIVREARTALAAARDQPTRERDTYRVVSPEDRHAFLPCNRPAERCAGPTQCHENGCGQPESAHQPTQEKPEDYPRPAPGRRLR